ncbi:hypothetical protein ACFONG_08585 [Uliginosibacterium paludis]|uniref:Type 4a pilus biogenesis protein PilO n=1 Tax=Uliginosibacterium paludis TaxID=1615952 RepID=A0ABV2CKA0_9RHOO
MREIRLPSGARFRLMVELAYWRHGWRLPLAAVSVLLLLGVAAWLPIQFARLADANAEFDRDARGSVSGVKAAMPPLASFREVLVMQDATPTQLRVIHQKASELGLQPGQLDMRRQQDGQGVFSQLQVTMPLKGSYLAVKRFCGDLLEYMPSVSIDQISIKRDDTRPDVVDAQIALSLWQLPESKQGGRP